MVVHQVVVQALPVVFLQAFLCQLIVQHQMLVLRMRLRAVGQVVLTLSRGHIPGGMQMQMLMPMPTMVATDMLFSQG